MPYSLHPRSLYNAVAIPSSLSYNDSLASTAQSKTAASQQNYCLPGPAQEPQCQSFSPFILVRAFDLMFQRRPKSLPSIHEFALAELNLGSFNGYSIPNIKFSTFSAVQKTDARATRKAYSKIGCSMLIKAIYLDKNFSQVKTEQASSNKALGLLTWSCTARFSSGPGLGGLRWPKIHLNRLSYRRHLGSLSWSGMGGLHFVNESLACAGRRRDWLIRYSDAVPPSVHFYPIFVAFHDFPCSRFLF